MILHGRSNGRLSGLSRAALAAFAALVLPWTATLTAEEADGEKGVGEAGIGREEPPAAGSRAADAEERIRSLRRQIDRLKKELDALEADTQDPAIHVEGKSVTLRDPATGRAVWTTTLDADLTQAEIHADTASKRIIVRTPKKTVALDPATGKVLEVKESRDPEADPRFLWTRDGGQATAALMLSQLAPGAALHAPAAPASVPVDVVRLGEALIEARGAMLLARNKLDAQAGADATGVISKSEMKAAEIQLQTAERKIELLRRMAQSALKGTKREILQLRQLETMTRLRLGAGESNEMALAASRQLAGAEMLADLLEDILRE